MAQQHQDDLEAAARTVERVASHTRVVSSTNTYLEAVRAVDAITLQLIVAEEGCCTIHDVLAASQLLTPATDNAGHVFPGYPSTPHQGTGFLQEHIAAAEGYCFDLLDCGRAEASMTTLVAKTRRCSVLLRVSMTAKPKEARWTRRVVYDVLVRE